MRKALIVGERVDVSGNIGYGSKNVKNKLGTVKTVTPMDDPCIEFDEDIGGHDCGESRDGHGWILNDDTYSIIRLTKGGKPKKPPKPKSFCKVLGEL